MAKSEETLLLLVAGAVIAVIGIAIGAFFMSNRNMNQSPTSSNLSIPSGWLIDRDTQGRPSAIISLPQGQIQ